jgi:lysylphosphatidylglycerol synthetase-like protein (DUF2156 family)
MVITHTPIWVWALFAFVLFMGATGTRDRTVALWRMLLMPAVLGLISLSGLVNANVASLPAIVLGLLAGGTAGWLLVRPSGIRRLANGRVWLRGEWWTFAQIVLILVFRYTTAIVPIMAPSLNADPTWHLATVFVSSVLSALFLGRVAARLKAYLTATPEPA